MKGIVYQIYIDSHPDIHYVGSTIQSLEIRWREHKRHFERREKGIPIICKYFKELGIDNFQIRVIKEYEVFDSKHLLAYEQLWINKLKPINILKTLIRSKHIIHFIDKTYRENNKELIKERKSSLYTCPCSPDKSLTIGSKARHERTIKHQKYLQTLEETKE